MPNKPTYEELEQRVKELEQEDVGDKRSKKEPHVSEEQLRALSEASFEAIFLSEKGICFTQNKSAEQMFGYTRSEAIEKPGTNWIIPEHRELVKNNMLSGYEEPYEVNALRKDGTSFPAEIQGKMIRFQERDVRVTALRDISIRKQAEDDLKQSELKFRILYESSSDAVMLLDDKGFFDCNGATVRMFTCKDKKEFCSKHPADLSPVAQPCGTSSMTLAKQQMDTAMKEGSNRFDWIHKRINGTDFPAEVFLSSMELDGKNILQAVVRDITERKQAEEQIKASLKEKETLLQEIHHRVKNNMQVVNSLLKLQSNNIEDGQIKEILKDSQSRVYAMAAVHETLHGSEKLSEIDLRSYLSKITTSIFQTYLVNHEKVKLNSDIDNSQISLNQAYPLGLTINELIANSLKYAFPDEREGEVSVSMKKLDKELELVVMDNGVGMPEGFDWKNSSTLGLKLVRTLVENQLDGSIDMESNKGTKFTIKFNIETWKKLEYSS